jgi:phage shock protein A
VSVWSRIVRLFKIRLQKRQGTRDPLRVLQRDLELLDEKVLEVKHNSLELGKHKIKLEHQIRDLDKHIKAYQEQARGALRLGREDLAKLALRSKQEAAGTQSQLREKVLALEHRIAEFEHVKAELINRIRIYKIKRDEVLLTRSAAEAELSAEEVRLGLSLDDRFGDSQTAFNQLETEIREIQARAEATRELSAAAELPPLPQESLPAPEETSASGPQVSAELERLKREVDAEQQDN